MQMLLVQLLFQISESTVLSTSGITKDEKMQMLLVTGCCRCLQSVCLQSAAANTSVSLCCGSTPVAAVVTLKADLSTGTQLVVFLLQPH